MVCSRHALFTASQSTRKQRPGHWAKSTRFKRFACFVTLFLFSKLWAHRSHSKLKIELKIKCCVLTFFRSHRKFKTKMNVWIRFSMLFLSYILFYFYFYFILIFESLPILVGCISVCTLLLIK